MDSLEPLDRCLLEEALAIALDEVAAEINKNYIISL